MIGKEISSCSDKFNKLTSCLNIYIAIGRYKNGDKNRHYFMKNKVLLQFANTCINLVYAGGNAKCIIKVIYFTQYKPCCTITEYIIMSHNLLLMVIFV